MVGVPAAQAASSIPYGTSGSSQAVRPKATHSYNFCIPGSCPYTTWTLGKHKTFTDGFGNTGTYTKDGKSYVFTIPNDNGSGVGCRVRRDQDEDGLQLVD